MPRLTKEDHERSLRDLVEEIERSGGDTPKMLELIQQLRDDFDEREGELRRYGEERDRRSPEGEEAEDKRIEEESIEDNREDKGLRRDPDEWVPRSDYDDLRRKYIDRFFTTPEDAKRSQEEDVKRDGKPQTFDELFKKREG